MARSDEFDAALQAATPKLRAQVRALCRNAELAEDIIQETMAKALQAHASFTPGTNISAWLYTIAKNEFRSLYRKFKREVEDVDGVHAEGLEAPDNPESAAILSQAMDAVDALPKDFRKAVRLVGMWGYSYKEAAGEMGVPEGTVKSRLHRARLMLRDENVRRLLPVDDSVDVEPVLATITSEDGGDTRSIKPAPLPPKVKPASITSPPPTIRLVDPRSLRVEPKYQRDLSKKSYRLIAKIVSGFRWDKFKPPVCAETAFGLVVIDGQHTAIAAATHPDIDKIPVVVTAAPKISGRAEAFVSHNRDRLAMSPFQVFHAEVAAYDKEANGVLRAVVAAGATIPRSPAAKGYAKPGQVVSVGEVRLIYRRHGQEFLERVLRIAVLSRVAPIQVTLIRALRMILSEPIFSEAAKLSDDRIAAAVASYPNLEAESVRAGLETGQGRHRACAGLICQALGGGA